MDPCEQARKELQDAVDEMEKVQQILNAGVMEPGKPSPSTEEFDNLPEDLEDKIKDLKDVIRERTILVQRMCGEE